MVTITGPYLIPLFLGMTYDARNTRPGIDIYNLSYVDDPQVVEWGTTESIYKVASSLSEVQEALDVSGDLSLKIKSGMVDIQGKGSYIKNERDYQNRIEVITSLKYISKVKSFKQEAKPRDNWYRMYSPSVLGTHYVSSITYGAEMIASARFVVCNSSDTSDVKADVQAALQPSGKAIDLVVNGTLDKLKEKLAGKANLEITYYGTVPLKAIPNDLAGLKKLVTSFEDQLGEVNLKEGIPISVTLSPLTDIAPSDYQSKFDFLKNAELEDSMAEFEEKMDELRQARLDLSGWSKGLPYDIPEDFQNRIGFLMANITRVSEIFYDVIWNMDLSKGSDQLLPAFDAYNYDKEGVNYRFDRLVRTLRAELDPKISREEVTSDTYVQWGSNNCTAPDTIVLYEGFAFSSAEEGIGGTAKYGCSPRSSEAGYEIAGDSRKSSLAGMRYTTLDKASTPFKGKYAKKVSGQGVPCAKCHSPTSYSVVMFPALENCPLSWEFMYVGYLMSSRNQGGHTTEYICVDEEPTEPYRMDSQTANKDTLALSVVHSEGSLPSEIYTEGALLRCVVCAMKSNQVTF